MAVKVDIKKCNGCGTCVDFCPVEAIDVDDKATIDENECIDCGACVDECPQDALKLD